MLIAIIVAVVSWFIFKKIWLSIILFVVIGITLKIIKSYRTNPVIKSRKLMNLDWDDPIMLKNEVTTIEEFMKIVSVFAEIKISEGFKIIKNAAKIGTEVRIAGRNTIYAKRMNPHYQPGEVYCISLRSGENSVIFVLIWIDKGWTHDDGYEFKYPIINKNTNERFNSYEGYIEDLKNKISIGIKNNSEYESVIMDANKSKEFSTILNESADPFFIETIDAIKNGEKLDKETKEKLLKIIDSNPRLYRELYVRATGNAKLATKEEADKWLNKKTPSLSDEFKRFKNDNYEPSLDELMLLEYLFWNNEDCLDKGNYEPILISWGKLKDYAFETDQEYQVIEKMFINLQKHFYISGVNEYDDVYITIKAIEYIKNNIIKNSKQPIESFAKEFRRLAESRFEDIDDN